MEIIIKIQWNNNKNKEKQMPVTNYRLDDINPQHLNSCVVAVRALFNTLEFIEAEVKPN